MENHKCKLCSRKFANGKALGGHMRSHMLNLRVPLKPGLRPSLQEESSPSPPPSPSFSSSGSEPEEGEIVAKGRLLCKLKDHHYFPKEKGDFNTKNSRGNKVVVVDEAAGSSSAVTLQDRESETESCRNVTRRRSKRTRKPASLMQYAKDYQHLDDDDDDDDQEYKLLHDDDDDVHNIYFVNNDAEQPGGSSISEVTSEEDVAFCLMMMSRDNWNNGNRHEPEKGRNNTNNQRKKYKCETCNKVFRSYQALGGHRASHKKLRLSVPENRPNNDQDNKNSYNVVNEDPEKKTHECPICFRVFASGQALGGHKRSHVGAIIIDNNPLQLQAVHSLKKNKTIADNWIDLNLPAPVDDDEEIISQIAFSAVSHVLL